MWSTFAIFRLRSFVEPQTTCVVRYFVTRVLFLIEDIAILHIIICLRDASVIVRKPPSITKGPQAEVIFKMNQQINLACKAEGTPAVT